MSDAGAPASGAHRAGFLAGLRVLELGDGVAGAVATSLLWSLGADVTAAVDGGSVHRHGRPSVVREGRPVSLLSVVLDRGKRLVTLDYPDDVARMVRGTADDAPFDVVVVDRVGGLRGPLGQLHDVARYLDFVDAHNEHGWVTISAFGLTGDRTEDVATELTLGAASGSMSSVQDIATGQPLKLGGVQSLCNTGQAGALAACHALDLTAGGPPVHLDLSALEATIAMGPALELTGLLLSTQGGTSGKRYGAPAGFYECIDGLVRVSAMEDHQWEGVVAAMGVPEWTSRFSTVESRVDGGPEVDAHITEWTCTLTKAEAESLLQAHGVPATAVYSPAEILASPQLAHRGAFESVAIGDGREASVIGVPYTVIGGDEAADGPASRRRTLRGLRVVEAGHVLAAPLAAALLGVLGAEVTKLEDLGRTDMYRRRGPYIDAEPGPERSAYFAMANHSKRGVAFDIDTDRRALESLLAGADVVIENLGRKRAAALGVAASVAGETHPGLLAVSSSGFGQDGPHAAYRAYAYNLQASAGLGYLTRNEDGVAADIDMASADLVSAYALATIVAAWAVGPSSNRGMGIDFAMADLIASHFNEFLAAASLDPDSDRSVDRANELSPFAPNGVYPTRDGYLAVSVLHDDQFGALAGSLGLDLSMDPSFDDAGERFEQRRELDRRIGAATRSHAGAELAAKLRAAGIPAEIMASAEDLLASPVLAAREFFVPVEHPVWGSRRLVGIPWRVYGRPPPPLGTPPLLALPSGP